MEKIKEYRGIIILILIIILGAFYWYELRPRNIIRECNENIYKLMIENDKSNSEVNRNFYDFNYKVCTRKHNL